jgi:hypothetical protein
MYVIILQYTLFLALACALRQLSTSTFIIYGMEVSLDH